MKKLITIILSVLLIASLFVSCDNATKSVQDELAEVTLSTQAGSRSLTVSNPLEALSDVAWTYKATKVTERQFNYGEKDTETSIILYPGEGQSKQILTLSQGKWKFELFGRSKDGNNTLLYHGKTGEVLILRSNGLNQITVEVSPYTDALGQISFKDVKLDRHDGKDISPNYLYVTGPNDYSNADTTFNGTKDLTGLKAGQYTVTVAWKETMTGDNPATPIVEASTNEWDLVIASETIVVTVYGGRTTEISGNISEETGSGTIDGNIEIKTKATQTKTVVADTPTTFTVNVAPANSVSSSKVENTTVTFAKGDFNSGIRTELEVSVKDLTKALDSGFTVGDGKAAAGITLTLSEISEEGTKTPITVLGKNIVIETHIVKGLSGVSVVYNGGDNESKNVWVGLSTANDKPVNNYYESDTGKLVFTTTHFSEYYVVADEVVVLNTNTNTAYATLADAINQANEANLKLLKDSTITDVVSVTNSKDINIDLRGYKIFNKSEQGVAFYLKESILTLDNGEIVDDSGNSAFKIVGSSTSGEYKTRLEIGENLTITGGETDVWVVESNNVSYGVIVDIYGSITGNQPVYVSGNVHNTDKPVIINVHSTANIVDTDDGSWTSDGTLYLAGYAKTTIENGAIIKSNNLNAIGIAAGELTINGGTITGGNTIGSTGTAGGSINSETAYAVFVKQHGTKLPLSVVINNGYFKASGALKQKGMPSAETGRLNVEINGGEFESSYSGDGANRPKLISAEAEGVLRVKGGTFSTDPLKYVPFGYNVELVGDKYFVSEASSLEIKTPDDLMKFAASVNAGNDYAGKTITLKKDIDLTGKTWVPIGYSSRSNTDGPIFRGTFDGQNHTITNISCTEKNNNMPSGFFGTVEGATISNLVIGGTKQENGSYVYDGQSSFTGEKDSAAGVVAFVIGSGNTVINNCKNYATISGPAPAGIVSRLYNKNSGSNKIEDCYNYGFIDGKNLAESGKAGGIVAITQEGSSSTISNCHNEGIIETYDFNAGGIIGYVNPGCIIELCTNSKPVSNSNTKDSRSVGGIVGWVANTSNALSISLNNCNNSGTINSDGCAGGIAGRICNQTTVKDCTNSGPVSNYNERSTGYAGGIIGNNDGGTINGCNNTAAVSGVEYSGGVVGYWGFTSNISGSISNCSGGKASINTNNWAGRIVGCANCVYSSEPFGTISIDDLNGDNYGNGLKTIGLSTFGTLKDVLTVQSGTLHGLPGLRDNSNQSEHTIIFKEGSKLNLDNKTYSFNTSVTFSTKEVNGKWTWDTSTLKSNKSGSASISKTNHDGTYGKFTVNEVEFLFQVEDGNSFADDEMTITVEELDQTRNDAWTIGFDDRTKYYRISITGLVKGAFGPNLYIKGATSCNDPEGSDDVLKAGYYSSSSIDGYFMLGALHY